jgi:hypothetical protein
LSRKVDDHKPLPRGSDDDSGDSVDRVTSTQLAGTATADLAGPRWHVANRSGSPNGEGILHHTNASGTNGNGLSRFGMNNPGLELGVIRRGGSLEDLQVGMDTYTTGLRPLCRKKMAFWSAGPKCGNYFHAAESGRRWDEMSLSIPDLCPCAIQSRSFELPYGMFFTIQGPESRSTRIAYHFG